MRSGGFGLGKKQNRGGDIRRTPPSTADLTQLLSSCQKNPEKAFAISWIKQNNENCVYTLTVVITGPARDRRGWSQSAIDNSGVGEAEWKLSQELDSLRSEIFSMKCSDAYLIQTLIDEALATGTTPFASGAGAPAPVAAAQDNYEYQQLSQNPPTPAATPGLHDGYLRQTPIRKLLETFNQNKTTGRLIVDIGTVQSEVFLTAGEPVHAKSSHSISQGRDTIGDASLIDLLTWKDGTYKFQEGWPAASKSITSPLSMFLAGQVSMPDPAAAASTPPPGQQSGGAGQAPASAPAQSAAIVNFQAVPGSQDDFTLTDDHIGSMYASLIDGYGLIRYGMLLMLARSEFLRFEKAQIPFCFACIELQLPAGVQITGPALTKIGERFEKVCQPLDTLSFAGGQRFFALFPQTSAAAAAQNIKQFVNNIVAIPLDTNLHGSVVKLTAGVSEMPRDGVEFQQIFETACGLRQQATPEKKIVAGL